MYIPARKKKQWKVYSPDEKRKKAENDFHLIEMMMSLSVAAGYTETSKDKAHIEKIKGTLESIFSMLGESGKKNKGFGWNYYAPFFAGLQPRSLPILSIHL